ncbi:hypothetical protein PIIN_10361 [Serendipita indica DSM 11827]|uniref:Uncharacterized protein n=1 Tax=Serendipita indica (strain DSM 11827) TaxID=1109443 RepID=G4TYH5_SERID|nr:hypothetical protein PIIN_10361 [Serendipita indica DSM 11827]
MSIAHFEQSHEIFPALLPDVEGSACPAGLVETGEGANSSALQPPMGPFISDSVISIHRDSSQDSSSLVEHPPVAQPLDTQQRAQAATNRPRCPCGRFSGAGTSQTSYPTAKG